MQGFVKYKMRLGMTAVCCIASCLLTWCAEADERTQLRLWNYRPPNIRTVVESIEREIFVRFVESHPEIEVVTSRGLSFMSGTSEMSRFMAMAAGTAPNVLMLTTRQLPLYIEQGMLVPLDEYLEDYEPWREMSPEFVEAATVDGRQYAVPALHRVPEIYSSYTFVKTNAPFLAVSTNHDLYLASIDGGDFRRITNNPALDTKPHYSPDGRYIAYAAMQKVDYESDTQRLMLYDRETGEHRGLTADLDRSVENIVWHPDGKRLFFIGDAVKFANAIYMWGGYHPPGWAGDGRYRAGIPPECMPGTESCG